ncbi:MAG: gliding motility-associated C-terminal domain-containing protein [Chitinophagales bacterium]|nr:gliding motility-associated C-terminal domain-containing protein [Chitinophagales bacterium]
MGRWGGIGLIVFCLFITGEVFASHAVGADLSYECLGANQYRITLNFYRDCNGVSAPSNPSVTFRSVSCNRNFSRNLTLQSNDEVVVLCPSQVNSSTCNGGSLPGVEQYIYSRVITLPAQCADWVISYDLCCRNAAITNLFDPGDQDLYIEARLNNGGGLCNNSPIFTTLPVPYICTNQQVSYNHGAVDADGDSLVYTTINPLSGPAENIPYTGGFNPATPLSLTGSFGFNAQTGQLTFTPSASQNAVITVRVDEYRNGLLIGSTMRDMQFVIINCGNSLPAATGVNGTANFTTTFCSGRQTCFTINTTDANASQVVTLNWNNSIGGASFNTTSSSRPTGTFCWTPTEADAGSHTFLADVQDNACPLFGSNVYAYTVIVEDAIVASASGTPSVCNGASNGNATVAVTGGSGNYIYLWNTLPPRTTATITGLPAGMYIVTVTDVALSSQCGVMVDTVTIAALPTLVVSAGVDGALCAGEGVKITASGANTYLWSSSQPCVSCTSIWVFPTASVSYSVVGTDSYGCTAADMVNIIVLNSSVNTLDITICAGDSVIVGASVYKTQGTSIDTLTASNGCDSIVTLNLHVLTVSLIAQSFSFCQGGSVMVGSSVYNSSGIYLDTLVAAKGCDSIITTMVRVRAPSYTVLNPVLCAGQTLAVGGSVYNSSGVYQDILVAANGCDSIITTNLTVINLQYVTLNPAICIGESFTVGSSTYTTTGIFTDTLIAASGCDSIVTTNLTVKPEAHVVLNHSICPGGFVVVGTSVYSATGSYVDTLTRSNGCDSIVTLNLIVLPTKMTAWSATICNGNSVVVGSSVYVNAGFYSDILTALNGCDSVVITTVIVRNPITVTLNRIICLGEIFAVGSSIYNSTGIFRDTVVRTNGCDSIITTNLTVINPKYVTVSASICAGDSYNVGTSNYTVAGSYIDTLTTASGCDSIVTVNLSVLQLSFESLNVQICQGQTMSVGSSVYASSGIFSDTLIAANGCDSIVSLSLTVLPILTETITVEMCQGDSAVVNGSAYNNTGAYYDTLVGSNGCDSILRINVVVHQQEFITVYPALCLGGTFTVGSTTYYSTGDYVDTLISSEGCDSVVTTHLTIADSLFFSILTTICAGENYVVGNSIYNLPGTYFDTIGLPGICDSVVHTQLVILPVASTTINNTICSGEVITVGTSTYSSSGNYADTLIAANGCDSIVTLNLTVLPVSVDTFNADICEGDSVLVGNSVYYYAGNYSDTLVKTNGCDSIIITFVSVRNRVYHGITSSICLGDTITVAGSHYSATGIYRDTLVSSIGCDSVITTNLTVVNPKFTVLNPSICFGESFLVGSSTYTASGAYVDTLVAASRCDSIVQTILTVKPLKSVVIDSSFCPGEFVLVGTSIYFNAGSYTNSLTASDGCDSIVTLHLAILPIAIVRLYPVICQGDSVEVGNSVYYNSGTYTDLLLGPNGCDSIVITTLQVRYPVVTTLNPVLCLGQTFTTGSSVYSVTGTYYDALIGANGCDSIITTNLTVLDPLYTTINTSICVDESFAVGSSTYNTSGTYMDTLIAASGCDSIVTLNLGVLPISVEVLNQEICEGDSLIVGSSVYYNTGNYIDTLVKSNGCDSIITTSLLRHDWVYTTLSYAICEGESVAVGNSVYDSTGTYSDTLTSWVGCDSIITTHLLVHPVFIITLDISICQGDAFVVGNSIYTSSGNYVDSLQSGEGCDSVVVTNLQIQPVFNIVIDSSICQGEIVVVGNSNYDASGNYIDTLIASNGCDSIVSLTLTVHVPVITDFDLALCFGDTFYIGALAYHQEGYYITFLTDQFGCDSIITLSLAVLTFNYNVLNLTLCEGENAVIGNSSYNTSGVYFDTLTTVLGCDSIVETHLTIIPRKYSVVTVTICADEQVQTGNSIYTSTGIYSDTLLAVSGCDSVITTQLTVHPIPFTILDTSFCVGDSMIVGNSVYTSTGIYFDTLSAFTGCDSIISTQLLVFPIINGAQDRFLCKGDTIQFNLSGGINYQWLNSTALSCNNCPNPIAYPQDDIDYLVSVTDINGCVGHDTIKVNVGFVDAVINISDSVACEGESLIFTGTFNSDDYPLTWLWNFGDGFLSVNQNLVYSFVDSGIFEIILAATNANGCEIIDTASITVIPNPEIIISNDTSICFGDSAQLHVSGASSYTWFPQSFLNDSDRASPIAFSSATMQYTVTATAQNGCVSFADVLITVNPLSVVQISQDTAICPNALAFLSVSGGTAYLWSPSDGLSDTISPNIIASPVHTTVYHVRVTNQFGCDATDSVRVEIYPKIQFEVSSSGDVCLVESFSLNAQGAVSYSWYPATGLSCSTCNNPLASPNSSTTYNVRGTDTNGCLYQDSVALAVRRNPFVQSINDITICKGETVILETDTSLVNSYSWSPAKFLNDASLLSPTSTPDNSTVYLVSVVNEYGCARWDTVHVNVIEEVVASLQGDDAVCRGESAMIEVEVEQASANGYDIRWLPTNYFSQQNLNPQFITPNQSMVVTAIITSETCAADTVQFEIEVNELPAVDAGEDRYVYLGENVRLHAESRDEIDSYNWSSPELLECGTCETTTWQAELSRSFVVNVVDENGCAANDTVLFRVTGGCKDDIFIPTGFTPNGDETNDKFFIRSVHEVKLEYFKIFDRWGREVYSSNDITQGWDGTHPSGWNGFYSNNFLKKEESIPVSDVIPGVYVYILKVGCHNGMQAMIQGNVTLIR